MPNKSVEDPGFGRDEALEKLRGTGRPAEANLEPHVRDDDPNPERHIHFSPDAEADED
jgi:hypothetical protein